MYLIHSFIHEKKKKIEFYKWKRKGIALFDGTILLIVATIDTYNT